MLPNKTGELVEDNVHWSVQKRTRLFGGGGGCGRGVKMKWIAQINIIILVNNIRFTLLFCREGFYRPVLVIFQEKEINTITLL